MIWQSFLATAMTATLWRLPSLRFFIVESKKPRVEPAGPLGSKVKSTSQIRRSSLCDRTSFKLKLSGLVDRGIDVSIAYDSGGVFKSRDIAYLGDNLSSCCVRDPWHCED